MTEENFRYLVREVTDENPFAVRAVLKVLKVEFTESIKTLAVTMEARPRLLVNLRFVTDHCATDSEVKAVICHELLHIILRHVEGRSPLSRAEHIATDAVINAIIHRTQGAEYSGMMSRYYATVSGPERLLRPMTRHEATGDKEETDGGRNWSSIWHGLYNGDLVVDDIREIAEEFQAKARVGKSLDIGDLLGSHAGGSELSGNPDGGGETMPDLLKEALRQTMKSMNGDGIWRSPKGRGIGTVAYDQVFTGQSLAMASWTRTTRAIFKRNLVPDRKKTVAEVDGVDVRMPILNAQDRRSYLRSQWSFFIPEATWTVFAPRRGGLAQVYLDVSGSMYSEMPLIVALLNQLRRYIKMPFWAFSDQVERATIVNGELMARTSGGTSLACVLSHIAVTRPPAAVIVTDGYVEDLGAGALGPLRGIRVHAIVSRGGDASQLERAGIPYTQLEEVPE